MSLTLPFHLIHVLCYEERPLRTDRDSPFSSLQTWMHRGWGGRCQVGSGELRESREPCSEAWQVTHSPGPSPSLAFFTVRIQVSHQAGQPSSFPIPSCPSWSESLKVATAHRWLVILQEGPLGSGWTR